MGNNMIACKPDKDHQMLMLLKMPWNSLLQSQSPYLRHPKLLLGMRDHNKPSRDCSNLGEVFVGWLKCDGDGNN